MPVLDMRASLILLLGLSACASTNKGADDLARLTAWMTGTFSSEAQAKDDPDYYAIRMVLVPIWTERDDGPWFYVEQAAFASMSSSPPDPDVGEPK